MLQLYFFELYSYVYNFQDKGMPYGRKIMIDLSCLYLAMGHIYYKTYLYLTLDLISTIDGTLAWALTHRGAGVFGRGVLARKENAFIFKVLQY